MQCKNKISNFFIFLIIVLAGGLFYANNFVFAEAGDITITGTVPGCGDGVIQTGESCDGSNLNSQTCSSQGFSSGTLSCTASCTFNTSSCTSAPPPSGGGGGTTIPLVTTVIFSGRAYPTSEVTILKDAQIAATTQANSDASFSVSLTGLSAGNYMFSLYSEDKDGRRSSLFTFPVYVSSGVTTNVSGIYIAPTIALDKTEVKRGDNISIFGQSSPESKVTININSEEEYFRQVSTDSNGVYLYSFDSSLLEYGDHLARSKSAIDGEISSYGKSIAFAVGDKNVATPDEQSDQAIEEGDTNSDSRVNLVDFSIVAYWYKRPSPPANVDLNGDKKVDLVDFSILAYYWTG